MPQLHCNSKRAAAARGPGQPYGSDGFTRNRAVGTCNTRHRDGQLRVRAAQRAFCHGPNGRFAYRAAPIEQAPGQAQSADLGLIAVSDESLREPLRAAGDIGEDLGDPSAGA